MTTRDDAFTVEIWMPSAGDGAKAALPALGRSRVDVSLVPLDTLSANLQGFIQHLQKALDAPDVPESDYVLDEIELSLALNATGGIALIGKIEAGASAAIKVKLKRKS
jgi:hypothetical protein